MIDSIILMSLYLCAGFGLRELSLRLFKDFWPSVIFCIFMLVLWNMRLHVL